MRADVQTESIDANSWRYLGISSRLALERYALRDPPPNEEQGTAAAAAYLAHQSSVYGTDLRGNYLVP